MRKKLVGFLVIVVAVVVVIFIVVVEIEDNKIRLYGSALNLIKARRTACLCFHKIKPVSKWLTLSYSRSYDSCFY